MRQKIEEIFSLDVRSLAIFRIALACNLLFDLAIRSLTMKAFFTDQGVVPRSNLILQVHNPWFWSIHFMGGTVSSQAILFALAAVFALGLLVGYRTRLMTFLSWVMLTSLHNRMPYILNSADVYMRMSLLWSCFLPLGACWSVDRSLHPSSEKVPTRIASWGSIALLVQTVLLYVTTSAYKFRGMDWYGTGSAIYYTLSLEVFATPVAHALLMFPKFLTGLTYFVMFYELIGALLLLCPFRNGPVRTAALLGFFIMHISFAICLLVDPFPRISMMELLPFFPTWFWIKMDPLLNRLDKERLWNRLQPLKSLWKRRLSGLAKRPLPLYPAPWEDGLVLFLLGLTVYGVLARFQLSSAAPPKMPAPASAVYEIMHLDQNWSMFAPEISRQSGWLVIPGKLQDGRMVNVYKKGAPLSWARPGLVAAEFETERWRRYLTQLMGGPGQRERLSEYSQYLCRNWNESHAGDDQLQSLTINLMANTALPNYWIEVPHRITLWRTRCIDEPEEPQPSAPPPSRHRPRSRFPTLVMQAPFAP